MIKLEICPKPDHRMDCEEPRLWRSAMKTIAGNSSSSVHRTPAVALNHPSYRPPVLQAAAALRALSEQYRLKKARVRKNTGHA
jgi:hypothetical protein